MHRFDWNQWLGKDGHSFVDKHKKLANLFLTAFKTYADENLTGDEANDVQETSAQQAHTKLSKIKPDLPFERNATGEPIFLLKCEDVKLEDKKHIFRCFLKAQYGK